MKTWDFSITAVVAGVVFVTCIAGHYSLRQVRMGWGRFLAWLLILGGVGSLSVTLFSVENIKHFKRSMYRLSLMSKTEECRPGQPRSQATREFSAFEEWAGQVRKLQRKTQKPRVSRNFSAPKGEECELRLPDEPMLHYRFRRLKKNLSSALDWGPSRLNFSEGFRRLRLLGLSAGERAEHVALDFSDWAQAWVEGREAPRGSSFLWVDQSEFQNIDRLTESLFKAQIAGVPAQGLLRPRLLLKGDSGLCEKIVADPAATPETLRLWKHLKVHSRYCEKLKPLELNPACLKPEGHLSKSSCDPTEIPKGITLSCVVREQNGGLVLRERKKIRWPELPPELDLDLRLVRVPERELSVEPEETREYRELRVIYELARVFDPQFVYEPMDSEMPGSPLELQEKVHLAQDSALVLTSLSAMDFFSPLTSESLPESLMMRTAWMDLNHKKSEFFRQFRSAYRGHRQEMF